MGLWADSLIRELDELRAWPPPKHREVLRRVSRGIAMRERDAGALRTMAGWDEGRRSDQRFVTDPMPSRISSAFQGLVFGREPEFGAVNEADQTRLDDLVRENNFRSELGRASRTASSEGEVWWRLYVDPDIADYPLLEWYSRTAVYPLWRSGRLMAVAFISRLEDHEDHEWRHFEVHEYDRERGGRVEHVLYKRMANRTRERDVTGSVEGKGAPDTRKLTHHRTEEDRRGLGDRVSLESHPETAGTQPVWEHGLPGMLGGRIYNLLESDPTLGVSDYWDPEDYLIELNIAASIAHANMELTARRRVIVPESQVTDAGTVDAGEQVFVEGSALNQQMGEAGRSGAPFKVLEYSFDAEALIAYKREIERTALNRIGIDAQYAGIDSAEGRAESGTALRIRLIPSQAAADDRAEDWDYALPKIVRLMQMLDALPRDEQRGFGRPWAKADEQPSIDRGQALPEDRTEQVERLAEAVQAKIMSRFTAVQEAHPEWAEEEVNEELRRIKEENKQEAPIFGATMPTNGLDRQGAGSDLAEEEPQAEAEPST